MSRTPRRPWHNDVCGCRLRVGIPQSHYPRFRPALEATDVTVAGLLILTTNHGIHPSSTPSSLSRAECRRALSFRMPFSIGSTCLISLRTLGKGSAALAGTTLQDTYPQYRPGVPADWGSMNPSHCSLVMSFLSFFLPIPATTPAWEIGGVLEVGSDDDLHRRRSSW